MDFNDYVDNSKLQELVNDAHITWNAAEVSFEKLLADNHLSLSEDIAMIAGKLYAQVNNGGFMQWLDNGYANHDNLVLLAGCVKTETVKAVCKLAAQAIIIMQEMEDDYSNYEYYEPDSELARLNKLDTAFDVISEQFFRDVNEWLESFGGDA